MPAPPGEGPGGTLTPSLFGEGPPQRSAGLRTDAPLELPRTSGLRTLAQACPAAAGQGRGAPLSGPFLAISCTSSEASRIPA